MEHVESLTDYEKLKKAEMAVVSVWPYVQKLMQLENEVSQLKAKIRRQKEPDYRHCAEHYSAGVFDWNTHGDSLGSEL